MAEDFSRSLQDVLSGYSGMQQTIGDFGVSPPQSLPNLAGAVPAHLRGMYGGGPMYIPPMAPPPPPPAPYVPVGSVASPYMASASAPTMYTPPPQPMPMPVHQVYQMGGYLPSQQPGGFSNPGQVYAAMQTMNINPAMAAMHDRSMSYSAPSMQTHASMGIYRDQTSYRSGSSNVGGSVTDPAPLPLIPGQPWLFRTRQYMFNRGYDAEINKAREIGMGYGQHYETYAQAAGRTMLGLGGEAVGTGIGAAIGGYYGGPVGALKGAGLGGMAGMAAQFIPGMDKVMASVLEPAMKERFDAIQAQGASKTFVRSIGADTDISGTGLSTTAAHKLAQDFGKAAKQSGGKNTRQDYVQLMQMAGEQGLLDFEQNRESIVKATKSLMSIVGTVSEMTNDPDFRSNIQKIANMRTLGLSTDRIAGAFSNMQTYARMAGQDMGYLMETSGKQGSQRWQQTGGNAAQGMVTGVYGAGLAAQLVSSGILSAGELSRLGGESGLAQITTDVIGSTIMGAANPLLTYLVDEDSKGNISVNKDKAKALAEGKISYSDALNQAANRRLTDQAMQAVTGHRRGEMVNQLSEVYTPEQGLQLAMRVTQDLATKNKLTMGAAAQTMLAGNEEGANVLMKMMDPRFQAVLTSQMKKNVEIERFEEYNKGIREVGFTSRRGWGAAGQYAENLVPQGYGVVGEFMAATEDDSTMKAVGAMRATTYAGKGKLTREAFFGGGAAGVLGADGKSRLDSDSFLDYRDADRAYMREIASSNARDANKKLSRRGGSIRDEGGERDDIFLKDKNFDARKIMTAMGADYGAAELEGAAESFRGRVGSAAYSKMKAVLAQRMRENTDETITQTDLMHTFQPVFGENFTLDAGGKENFSAAELRALISEAAMMAGSRGSQKLRTSTEAARRAVFAGVGRDFTSGVDNEYATGKLNALFGHSGKLDPVNVDINKLTDSQQIILDQLTEGQDPTDVFYLFLEAAKERSDAVGDAVVRFQAALEQKDPKDFAVRSAKAKAAFNSLNGAQQEALILASGNLTGLGAMADTINTSGITAAKATEHATSQVKLIEEIGAIGPAYKAGAMLKSIAGKIALQDTTSSLATVKDAGGARAYIEKLRDAKGKDKTALEKALPGLQSRLQGLNLDTPEGQDASIDLIKEFGNASGEITASVVGGDVTNTAIQDAEGKLESMSGTFSSMRSTMDEQLNVQRDMLKALDKMRADPAELAKQRLIEKFFD